MNRKKNKKHILSDTYRKASDKALDKLANAPSANRIYLDWAKILSRS